MSPSPTSDPGPVTMLATPSGRPASSRALKIATATPGASDAGFSTRALPVASAGAIF